MTAGSRTMSTTTNDVIDLMLNGVKRVPGKDRTDDVVSFAVMTDVLRVLQLQLSLVHEH